MGKDKRGSQRNGLCENPVAGSVAGVAVWWSCLELGRLFFFLLDRR